jgi:hypothetical protein
VSNRALRPAELKFIGNKHEGDNIPASRDWCKLGRVCSHKFCPAKGTTRLLLPCDSQLLHRCREFFVLQLRQQNAAALAQRRSGKTDYLLNVASPLV